MGHEPVLAVSDPQLIKDICIKDFHIFVNRSGFRTNDPFNDKILFNLFGDEWKRMRSIVCINNLFQLIIEYIFALSLGEPNIFEQQNEKNASNYC